MWEAWSTFHLNGKVGFPRGRPDGTGLSTENFPKRREYLQRYSSFLTFAGITSKSLESIRLWCLRFDWPDLNPIPLNQHKSFPLLLIPHAGSWFAWDLENIADLGLEGALKMFSIRVDSIESTWVVSTTVDSTCRKSTCANNVGWVKNVVDSTRFDTTRLKLWPRFKNDEGSCVFISRILTSGGLCRVG